MKHTLSKSRLTICVESHYCGKSTHDNQIDGDLSICLLLYYQYLNTVCSIPSIKRRPLKTKGKEKKAQFFIVKLKISTKNGNEWMNVYLSIYRKIHLFAVVRCVCYFYFCFAWFDMNILWKHKKKWTKDKNDLWKIGEKVFVGKLASIFMLLIKITFLNFSHPSQRNLWPKVFHFINFVHW